MEKLAEILNEELEVFNQFLNLLDSQHKYIISGELKGLNETTLQMDMLSNKARNLESNRMELVNDLSASMQLGNSDIKLGDILPRLEKSAGNRLERLKDSILRAHKQAEEKSLRNKKLIDRSRKLIADSLKLATTKPSPVYQKPGPVPSSIRECGLVNKSV